VARKFGLFQGQIAIMIHCGSRGAGHQICTDHLEVLSKAVRKYNIDIPDKQLACAPLGSPEAEHYFEAMVSAANYAWANRHIIAHWTREVFERYFPGSQLDLIYDVAHNVAKIEEHSVDGQRMKLYVHRKGPLGPLGPAAARSLRPTGTWANPCSYPEAWARPLTCSAATTAPWNSPSARPATGREGS